jgi:RNA recognition motif-containing protein
VFNLSFANSPNSPYTEYNVLVNNLADEVTDKELFEVGQGARTLGHVMMQLFGNRYRSCRGAKVYRHYDGTSKNSGFVRFTDKSEQQAALIEMGRETLHGRTVSGRRAHTRTCAQITLKLQEGRFMAPRGARYYGATDYDPINYYPITVAREMYASRDYARREQENYEVLKATQQMPLLLADGTVEFPSYGTNMVPPPEKYMMEVSERASTTLDVVCSRCSVRIRTNSRAHHRQLTTQCCHCRHLEPVRHRRWCLRPTLHLVSAELNARAYLCRRFARRFQFGRRSLPR